MIRRTAVVYSIAWMVLNSSWMGEARAQDLAGSRPNIVFILADDMGWAQPGFNGEIPGRLRIWTSWPKNLSN